MRVVNRVGTTLDSGSIVGMERIDRPAERARLLGGLYDVTGGSVREHFDPFEVAASMGLRPEAARAAVGFLAQEQMIAKADGKQYEFTSRGIRAVEKPTSVEPVAGLNVSILNNYGKIKGSNVAGRDQRVTPEATEGTRPRTLLIALIIGIFGSLMAAGIWAFGPGMVQIKSS